MNQDQAGGVFRTLLTAAGTYLGAWMVSHGYLTTAQLGTLSGFFNTMLVAMAPAIPIFISLFWTLWANTKKQKTASVAATLPPASAGGVIVTDDKTAKSIPNGQVMGVSQIATK